MATESRRPVIEPTRVIGPLRTVRRLDDDELFRPAEAAVQAAVQAAAQTAAQAAEPAAAGEEDDTQVLSSVPASTAPSAPGAPGAPGWWSRRARLTLVVAGSVGAGFLLATVLMARVIVPGGGDAAAAGGSSPQPSVSPSASASAQYQAQAGVLRQGDSGSAVSDLQSRLLRIPDVYTDGKVDGKYDSVLAEAVARFQLWYGIRGDEDGEYGDATRRDLEARTSSSTSTGS
ncbi:peptidoglycan-binding domain-containing protein [Streptomyces sp. NBC_01262]|uniref:peptidoglycan-binding domain-containing protein n=1 Tax=Streptomyces sp. NBC_01262 TaxID=2903803 RepID=UPI002E36AB54|nr:peptidoglycan-binding domain-containing protein [Streptomyces sp. NBC_01262]